MMSPMRKVSRAAMASATGGVSSRDSSRWRGPSSSVAPADSGSIMSTSRPIGPMKARRPTHRARLNSRWKLTIRRTGSASNATRCCAIWPRKGRASSTPRKRKIRLPSGIRRATRGSAIVALIAGRAAPRLMPSTIGNRAAGVSRSLTGEAGDQQDHGEARIGEPGQEGARDDRQQRLVGNRLHDDAQHIAAAQLLRAATDHRQAPAAGSPVPGRPVPRACSRALRPSNRVCIR